MENNEIFFDEKELDTKEEKPIVLLEDLAVINDRYKNQLIIKELLKDKYPELKEFDINLIEMTALQETYYDNAEIICENSNNSRKKDIIMENFPNITKEEFEKLMQETEVEVYHQDSDLFNTKTRLVKPTKNEDGTYTIKCRLILSATGKDIYKEKQDIFDSKTDKRVNQKLMEELLNKEIIEEEKYVTLLEGLALSKFNTFDTEMYERLIKALFKEKYPEFSNKIIDRLYYLTKDEKYYDNREILYEDGNSIFKSQLIDEAFPDMSKEEKEKLREECELENYFPYVNSSYYKNRLVKPKKNRNGQAIKKTRIIVSDKDLEKLGILDIVNSKKDKIIGLNRLNEIVDEVEKNPVEKIGIDESKFKETTQAENEITNGIILDEIPKNESDYSDRVVILNKLMEKYPKKNLKEIEELLDNSVLSYYVYVDKKNVPHEKAYLLEKEYNDDEIILSINENEAYSEQNYHDFVKKLIESNYPDMEDKEVKELIDNSIIRVIMDQPIFDKNGLFDEKQLENQISKIELVKSESKLKQLKQTDTVNKEEKLDEEVVLESIENDGSMDSPEIQVKRQLQEKYPGKSEEEIKGLLDECYINVDANFDENGNIKCNEKLIKGEQPQQNDDEDEVVIDNIELSDGNKSDVELIMDQLAEIDPVNEDDLENVFSKYQLKVENKERLFDKDGYPRYVIKLVKKKEKIKELKERVKLYIKRKKKRIKEKIKRKNNKKNGVMENSQDIPIEVNSIIENINSEDNIIERNNEKDNEIIFEEEIIEPDVSNSINDNQEIENNNIEVVVEDFKYNGSEKNKKEELKNGLKIKYPDLTEKQIDYLADRCKIEEQYKDRDIILEEVDFVKGIKEQLKEKYPDKTEEEIAKLYLNCKFEDFYRQSRWIEENLTKSQRYVLPKENEDGNVEKIQKVILNKDDLEFCKNNGFIINNQQEEKEKNSTEDEVILETIENDDSYFENDKEKLIRQVNNKYPELTDEEISNLLDECYIKTTVVGNNDNLFNIKLNKSLIKSNGNEINYKPEEVLISPEEIDKMNLEGNENYDNTWYKRYLTNIFKNKYIEATDEEIEELINNCQTEIYQDKPLFDENGMYRNGSKKFRIIKSSIKDNEKAEQENNKDEEKTISLVEPIKNESINEETNLISPEEVEKAVKNEVKRHEEEFEEELQDEEKGEKSMENEENIIQETGQEVERGQGMAFNAAPRFGFASAQYNNNQDKKFASETTENTPIEPEENIKPEKPVIEDQGNGVEYKPGEGMAFNAPPRFGFDPAQYGENNINFDQLALQEPENTNQLALQAPENENISEDNVKDDSQMSNEVVDDNQQSLSMKEMVNKIYRDAIKAHDDNHMTTETFGKVRELADAAINGTDQEIYDQVKEKMNEIMSEAQEKMSKGQMEVEDYGQLETIARSLDYVQEPNINITNDAKNTNDNNQMSNEVVDDNQQSLSMKEMVNKIYRDAIKAHDANNMTTETFGKVRELADASINGTDQEIYDQVKEKMNEIMSEAQEKMSKGQMEVEDYGQLETIARSLDYVQNPDEMIKMGQTDQEPEKDDQIALPAPEKDDQIALPAPEKEDQLALPAPEKEDQLALPAPEKDDKLTLPAPENPDNNPDGPGTGTEEGPENNPDNNPDGPGTGTEEGPENKPENIPEAEKKEKPTLQEILNKIKYGVDEKYNMTYKEGTTSRYDAYQAKNIRIRDHFKQNLRTGNIKYNIANLGKTLVGSLGIAFQKIRGKLLNKEIKQKFDMCQEVIDNLSDEELEVLLTQFKGINAKNRKDIPLAAEKMIAERLHKYVQEKTEPIAEIQTDRYKDLLEYYHELNKINEELAQPNIAEERKDELNKRKQEIIDEVPDLLNGFKEDDQMLSDTFSSGYRGFLEDQRATRISKMSGGMNYKGYGDAKVAELSKEESDIVANAEKAWKNPNLSPEERLNAFHEYQDFFPRNSKIEKKWYGYVDTGSTSFDPIGHELDYTADSYYKDLMMTAAVATSVISSGMAIYTHLYKIPELVNEVKDFGSQLTGFKKAFMEGQKQMIDKDYLGRMDISERMNAIKAGNGLNWDMNAQYNILDDATHLAEATDFKSFVGSIQQSLQNGDINLLGNICTQSAEKCVQLLKNNYQMMQQYVAANPGIDLEGYMKSLESVINNPTAIASMNDAMENTISIGEKLASIENFPSDLITTLIGNVTMVTMAGRILNESRKARVHTDKNGEFIDNREFLAEVTRGEIVPSEDDFYYYTEEIERIKNIIKEIEEEINECQEENRKKALIEEKKVFEDKLNDIKEELKKNKYKKYKGTTRPVQEKQADPEVKKNNRKKLFDKIINKLKNRKKKKEGIIDLGDENLEINTEENENGPKSR